MAHRCWTFFAGHHGPLPPPVPYQGKGGDGVDDDDDDDDDERLPTETQTTSFQVCFNHVVMLQPF